MFQVQMESFYLFADITHTSVLKTCGCKRGVGEHEVNSDLNVFIVVSSSRGVQLKSELNLEEPSDYLVTQR